MVQGDKGSQGQFFALAHVPGRGMLPDMTKNIYLAVCVFMGFGSLWDAAAAQTARVTGDRVNLRARPDLSGVAEAVAQAKYNDVLRVRSISNEWVEVAVPEHVDLWASREYLQPDHRVAVKRLRIRCGPGINYHDVDIVEGGAQLVAREQGDAPAGWLRIAPTDGASLWIYREYVELQDDTVEKERVTPAETSPVEARKPSGKKKAKTSKSTVQSKKPPEPAGPEIQAANESVSEPPPPPEMPVVQVVPTPQVAPSIPEIGPRAEVEPRTRRGSPSRDIPPPAPADLKLIPLEGQGRMTVVEGEVRAAPLITEAPARYRVVRWQENQWKILGHLYGEPAKYRPYQNKKVRVEGREYWIQKASAPVIVPVSIAPLTIPDPAEVLLP